MDWLLKVSYSCYHNSSRLIFNEPSNGQMFKHNLYNGLFIPSGSYFVFFELIVAYIFIFLLF